MFTESNHPHSPVRLTLKTAAFFLGSALFLAACNQNAGTTPPANAATETTGNPPATAATPAATASVTAIPIVSPTVAASPVTAGSPVPPATAPVVATPPPAAATPAAQTPQQPPSPANPIGPDGKPLNPAIADKLMDPSKLVVTTGRPKPVAEPTLPPAPTPTPVYANGKIVQEWQAPAEFAAMKNPMKGKKAAVAIGREYYLQRCEACHGREGKGNGGMSKLGTDKGEKGATNLASEMVQANTDGELFYKVTNAKPPHPASRERFTDEQRWYIVSFLRTFKPSKK